MQTSYESFSEVIDKTAFIRYSNDDATCKVYLRDIIWLNMYATLFTTDYAYCQMLAFHPDYHASKEESTSQQTTPIQQVPLYHPTVVDY